MTTRSQTNNLKPRQFLTTTTPSPKIPITYKQAKLIPQWSSAMQAEFNALARNHTWDLVPCDSCDSSKNMVDCKWLFHIKHKPDGSSLLYPGCNPNIEGQIGMVSQKIKKMASFGLQQS